MPHARYSGALTVEPPLNKSEIKALRAFFQSDRILTRGGPLDCRTLPTSHPDVIDVNAPAEGQPGLRCDLKVSDDGTTLTWARSEESEPNLHEWIIWLINCLLKPGAEYDIRERNFDLSQVLDDNLLRSFTFDHHLNGQMAGAVPKRGGVWKIVVRDNVVSTEPVKLAMADGDPDSDEE